MWEDIDEDDADEDTTSSSSSEQNEDSVTIKEGRSDETKLESEEDPLDQMFDYNEKPEKASETPNQDSEPAAPETDETEKASVSKDELFDEETQQPESESVETPTDPAPGETDTSEPSADNPTNDAFEDRLDYETPPEHADTIFAKYSWPGASKFDSSEKLIHADNPSPLVKLREYVGGVLIILVGIGISINFLLNGSNEIMTNYPLIGIDYAIPNLFLLQNVFFIGFAIIFIGYHHAERTCQWYFVTNQRTFARQGIISQVDVGSLEHRSITNIVEKNPFPERQFGVGHIELSTASSDGAELILSDVHSPSQWVGEIRSHMQDSDSNKVAE